jgi:DNA replication protein DnaC
MAMDSKRWPIYLCGEAGRGKSCAAASIYCGWSRSALWLEANAVVADIINCRTNGRGFIVRTTAEQSWDEWGSQIERKVRDASLVVFDDVGMRRPTEAAFEVFFGLINLRRGKPTIYTGNPDPKRLCEVYDRRIASRLLCGTVIELTGADRRIQGTKYVKI